MDDNGEEVEVESRRGSVLNLPSNGKAGGNGGGKVEDSVTCCSATFEFDE